MKWFIILLLLMAFLGGFILYMRGQLSLGGIMDLFRKIVMRIVRFCSSVRTNEVLNKEAETTNSDARFKTILDASFNNLQEYWMRRLDESEAQMQKTVGALTVSVQELKNELSRFMVKVEQKAQKLQPEKTQVAGSCVPSTLFAIDMTDVGNGEYGFRVADLLEKPTDSFFVLYLLKKEHAEFRLSDNPRIRIQLYALLGKNNIGKVCSWAGDVPLCIDSIVNYAPGKLELEGDVWRIKEKVQIKFISKQNEN